MSKRATAPGSDIPEYTWAVDPSGTDPWVTVFGGDLPCQIEIRFGVEPRGRRLICTGLRVGRPDDEKPYEITKRMLTDISIANVLRAIRAHASGESADPAMTTPLPPNGLSLGEMLAQAAQPMTLSVRRGRRGLEDETLLTTAELYRDAVARNDLQPRVSVALELGVDPSTVWRRLQKAWERFPELRPKGDEDGASQE